MGCSRGLDGRGPGGAHPPHRHAAPGLCWADGRRLLWTRSLRGGAPRGEEAGTAREPSSPSIHAAQVLGCPHGQAVRHLTAGGRSRPPHRDERDGWRARAMCSRNRSLLGRPRAVVRRRCALLGWSGRRLAFCLLMGLRWMRPGTAAG